MTPTILKKLSYSIFLQKSKRQFLNEIITNVLYVDVAEKTESKYVQTTLSQRIRVVTILLITDKLCVWNIIL